MAFPLSPTNGQQYTTGGFTYQYNSTLRTWTKVASTGSNIGNVSLSSGTVTTGNTSISTTGVNVGGATLSNIGVNVGNVTLSNTGVNVGNVTLSNTGVNVGNVSVSNTGVNVGNVILSTTGVNVGNVSVSNTGVNVGNTTLNNTSITTNTVTATTFIGNGAGLTNITGANVTGQVTFAAVANSVAGANVTGQVSYAAIANSVAGANVSGQVSNALISGTVYTNAQPNITSIGSLTSLAVAGDTTITGNLTVTGTTITVNSNNVSYTDSIIELHTPANLAPLTTDDGKDVGIQIHYFKTSDKHAFFGFANDTKYLEYYVDGTETAGVFSGTYGNFKGDTFIGNVNGNLVSANFVSGNGSALTSLTGANVTGSVPIATVSATVSSNSQSNITSVGTLLSLDVTGNITGGNANLGNVVTANYFIGNGALLTGVAVTDGNGITTLGTLSNLNVSGNVSFSSGTVTLGTVSNVKLTGGSYGYVLSTDGLGNLAWTTQPSPTTLLVDTFTGTGSQTQFTLSSTPDSVNKTFVNYNGVSLARSSYSLSGGNIVFSTAPAYGASIEVSTFQALGTQVNLTNVTVANLTTTSWATYQQTTDILVTKTGATGTVTHDLNTGAIFYHTSPAASFTVNLTNVPVTNSRTITVVLIVIQGSTPYIPSVLQIAGAGQTINWAAGVTPLGNANKKDIFTFTLLRVSDTWTVLGSLGTYG